MNHNLNRTRFVSSTGAAKTAALAPLLLGVATLFAGCLDPEQDEDFDPNELAPRDDADKVETPRPSADGHQDLVQQGKPQKDLDVGSEDIEGQYIVQMKPGGNPKAAAAAVKATPKHLFTHALTGFAGPLNKGQLNALMQRPDVEAIEPDQLVTTVTTQNMNAGQPWGLDRIDQAALPLLGTYTYTGTAPNVHVYVIDTGIHSAHPDFEGRATAVYDVFGGNGQDCNGHGTHVAGTIGGKVYGVAKETRLHGVRVLGCNGSGSWIGVILGMEWVAKHHIKPAVANMSLGGGYSAIVNAAANRLADSGVFVAVAAGNNNANACDYSPASATKVFSTAASSKTDARASFSNYGKCVTGYAPGVGVRSAWKDGASAVLSGTSMASPHVAGTAALYKALSDEPWDKIKAKILDGSIKNMIVDNKPGTANMLLHHSL